MNADQLKASVLQLAIEGKLVPQLDSEPGVDIDCQESEDVPFSIPEKWKWTTLKRVGKWKAGATPKRGCSEYYENGTIPWLKTGDLNDGHVVSIPECITDLALRETSCHLNPVGSVLLAMYGATIGKIGILDIPAATNQACCACCVDSAVVDNEWLFYFLLSQRAVFIRKGAGGAQPNISKEKIESHLVPLPPLAEQRRIVARLEEILPIIEEYGKSQEALDKLDEELPAKLKASILQQAIEGKLVPQLDSEPAVDIDCQEPEEVPFSIPERWKWVSLSQVGDVVGGGTPRTSVSEYWGGKIPWITPADLGKLQGKYIERGAKNITEKGLAESSAKMMPSNSVVYSSRAPIGHIAICTQPVCTNQGCKSFVPNATHISEDWAYYVMIAVTPDIQSRASGTTFKEISGKGIGETMIPLPPFSEQRRIVSRLEELLPEVDKLVA